MEGLEKRAAGDWIDIREAAKDYDTLDAYFKVPPEQIRIQIEKLEFAVEQGIVEYKRAALAPLFGMLEGARFRAPALDQVRRQLEYTNALLFAMLVQRQIAEGILKLAREKRAEESSAAEGFDLTSILRDVNERIRKAPELTGNPIVKNIQLQAGQLRRERENMQKLLPTIKPEARDTFQQNYRKTFGELVDKIKRGYGALIKEETPEPDEPRPILAVVRLPQAVPALTDQSQKVARARSTLAFASEEKYRIREIFEALAGEKAAWEQALQREVRIYAKLESEAENERVSGERSIARAYCTEIVRVLQRTLTYRP